MVRIVFSRKYSRKDLALGILAGSVLGVSLGNAYSPIAGMLSTLLIFLAVIALSWTATMTLYRFDFGGKYAIMWSTYYFVSILINFNNYRIANGIPFFQFFPYIFYPLVIFVFLVIYERSLRTGLHTIRKEITSTATHSVEVSAVYTEKYRSLFRAGINIFFFHWKPGYPLAFIRNSLESRIYISREFFDTLSESEADALILHEMGHKHFRHLFKNNLFLAAEFSLIAAAVFCYTYGVFSGAGILIEVAGGVGMFLLFAASAFLAGFARKNFKRQQIAADRFSSEKSGGSESVISLLKKTSDFALQDYPIHLSVKTMEDVDRRLMELKRQGN